MPIKVRRHACTDASGLRRNRCSQEGGFAGRPNHAAEPTEFRYQHTGKESGEVMVNLDKNTLFDAYRRLKTIREFEMRLRQENQAGQVPGFIHL